MQSSERPSGDLLQTFELALLNYLVQVHGIRVWIESMCGQQGNHFD